MSILSCSECEFGRQGNEPHGLYFCTRFESTCGLTIGCEHGKRKAKTNADRIRAMDDEQLAEFIENACCPPVCYTKHFDECQKEDCVPCWLAWLKEEVKT